MRHFYRYLLFALAIFVAAASGAGGASAGASELTVTRTNDPAPNGCFPDDCSLREAVLAANGLGGTIHLPPGTYSLSRGGQLENGGMTGDLDISADVNIIGAGPSATIVDAKGIDRVFQVTSGNVAISGLKITGGAIELNDGESSSGGLLNMGNTTLSNVAVSDNTTWGDGGGINNGNGGTLTITDSVISGNTSESAAGGIENGGSLTIERSRIEGNEAFVGGGIDHYAGTLTLTDSTVSSNNASGAFGGGGGIQNGGNAVLVIEGSTIAGNSAKADGAGLKARDNSTATITNSTFSGNDASDAGGGIAVFDSASVDITSATIAGNSAKADGAGLKLRDNSTATITNSTFSGNDASDAGGGIAVFDGASVDITNATIADNHSDDAGGGVFNDESGQQVTISNSILHGNSAPSGAECAGDVSSLGHNVIGPVDGCMLLNGVTVAAVPGAGTDIFADPGLGPLQDNGGPTVTYAITDDSPAFDAGASDGCPATDQRGVERPQGAGCDVGAFELEVEVDTGLFGDVDCDSDVDSVDALKILLYVAGLPYTQHEPCTDIATDVAGALFGDLNCNGDVSAVDSLAVLRFVAGLPPLQSGAGCEQIGA